MADQFIPFSNSTENDPNQFLNKAIRLVHYEITVREEPSDDFQVYIISFSYVLGNWKAYLSSSLPNGKIYEASYDRDKRVTYIDTYGKVRNEPVYDDAEAEEEVLRQQELEERGNSPW